MALNASDAVPEADGLPERGTDLLGVDDDGIAHVWHNYTSTLYGVRDGAIVESYDLADVPLERVVDKIGERRGWAECRYEADGWAAMAAGLARMAGKDR